MPDSVPIKVCLVSLGCPKNLVDSEKMLAAIAEGGCVVGATMDQADAIVINTCGFLSAARDESLGVIAEALEHKRSGSAKRVIVAGCLPSRDGEALYGQADGIDAVVGVFNRDEILKAVIGEGQFTGIDKAGGPCGDDLGRLRLTPRHTAFLRIAEGCSRRCTYCTIPQIRGPYRSKPVDTVLAEAAELISDGAIELNLIAQDTTAYGSETSDGATLAALLRKLDALDGVEWLRLMYTYPQSFSDELIDAMASCERVLPYVDMPLQHISDDVLRRMGRGIKRTQIESVLTSLRDRVAGMVLRTTFIVGFPGETEGQFEELLQFVNDFEFDALGVFEYSPEEGTPAADMPDQIPDDVKAYRAEQIMLAQQKIVFDANESVIDSPITVLVDGPDDQGRCVGRYYGQAPEIDSLCILTSPAQAGTFVEGKIVGADGYDLIVD